MELELKMPSSSCFNQPTVIWTKQAALSGSCSLISPVHLTQSSLMYFARNSRRHRWGASTITWIKDYLTNRPQFVRLKNCTSNQAIGNIGAPQGTVLSPFLFTLYTSDFQYKSETCHLQKHSDDSAVVGCIRDGQEAEYRELVERFVAWCGNNHLTLNVNKTKEMILDFRRNRVESNTVSIMGEEVEVVEEYKYLGVHLDNRLDWRKNSKAVYKKGHSRLHFLRMLRSFNVCSKMQQIFYKTVVESVISSAIVCWGSSIRSRDLKRLNSLIKKAGSVLGTTVEPLEEIMQRRILQRIKKMMDNPEHSLHKTVRQQKSVFSQRLLQFGCNTDCYWRSFLPTAIFQLRWLWGPEVESGDDLHELGLPEVVTGGREGGRSINATNHRRRNLRKDRQKGNQRRHCPGGGWRSRGLRREGWLACLRQL
nr:uncharacterized protein LOC129154572 [Nothobranchius furzeri]